MNNLTRRVLEGIHAVIGRALYQKPSIIINQGEVDILVGGWVQDIQRPFLNVEFPCGGRYALYLGDELPTTDIPCTCGNPRHFFWKIGNYNNE